MELSDKIRSNLDGEDEFVPIVDLKASLKELKERIIINKRIIAKRPVSETTALIDEIFGAELSG